MRQERDGTRIPRLIEEHRVPKKHVVNVDNKQSVGTRLNQGHSESENQENRDMKAVDVVMPSSSGGLLYHVIKRITIILID